MLSNVYFMILWLVILTELDLDAHLKSYSLELVNGKKITSLSKASLCVYAKKVFSLKRVIAAEMKTTCFLVLLGFFLLK